MNLHCSTCGREFDPATSRAMPFCSVRCKQIDLRRWLTEQIGIPVERKSDDEVGDDPAGESDVNSLD